MSPADKGVKRGGSIDVWVFLLVMMAMCSWFAWFILAFV